MNVFAHNILYGMYVICCVQYVTHICSALCICAGVFLFAFCFVLRQVLTLGWLRTHYVSLAGLKTIEIPLSLPLPRVLG